ncbi:MAG TPA: ribonuclease HI family protein [Methanolinea sp.]|jgi:ribonuclease HI|nr:ribonuclease HI family protein [Methanolinea sp.]MDI6898746.1 ribonuclease HI family protein [Methanolinea sp.]HOS82462.1 ribonuclease HI family protein [Methanolinea sp.]HPC55720.1 ribonuclease HI family protein [Methanolinea sp.]HQE85998.1 ribonuclease HI family protein [Methanolinea sp.]
MEAVITCYTDGASRGNPGPAAAGFVLLDSDGRVLEKKAVFLGKKTNNEAEYHAVINALAAAKKHGAHRVRICSDSQLVIRQLRGEYRVNKPGLRELCARVRLCEQGYSSVEYVSTGRDHPWIQEADRLCNGVLNAEISRSD